ncbi:MAG: hypothetical protein LH617_12575 [Ramlibacter sp.]|nr:hypothetical protein [Ramlibacter sp.]
MKLIFPIAAALMLAGCSTVSTVRDAWDWDPTASQQRIRVVSSSPAQLAALNDRVAQLQIQRNDLRTRISAEPDILTRQRLYADLHRVGQQLSPLERELLAAAAVRR